jgi:hypothetical protein
MGKITGRPGEVKLGKPLEFAWIVVMFPGDGLARARRRNSRAMERLQWSDLLLWF